MSKIARSRIDALTDGVFAISMTILVIEIRLPDGVSYSTPSAFLNALGELGTPTLSYVISFFVLALFWRGFAAERVEADADIRHVNAWLAYLFFMTCIPISTSIVGNHENMAPAIWIYAANMICGAIAYWIMVKLGAPSAVRHSFGPFYIRFALLIASSLVAVIVSFVTPELAMWVFTVNLAAPFFMAWLKYTRRGRHIFKS